jgi:hypothetical protein
MSTFDIRILGNALIEATEAYRCLDDDLNYTGHTYETLDQLHKKAKSLFNTLSDSQTILMDTRTPTATGIDFNTIPVDSKLQLRNGNTGYYRGLKEEGYNAAGQVFSVMNIFCHIVEVCTPEGGFEEEHYTENGRWCMTKEPHPNDIVGVVPDSDSE